MYFLFIFVDLLSVRHEISTRYSYTVVYYYNEYVSYI